MTSLYAMLDSRSYGRSSLVSGSYSSLQTDVDYTSCGPCDRSSHDSFPHEFGLSHSMLRTLRSPADMFSDNMKKRLDPVRHNDMSPPSSLLPPSIKEMLPPRRPHTGWQAPPPLTVLVQLPYHSRSVVESPLHSEASARSGPFSYRSTGSHPSATESMELDRLPRAEAMSNNNELIPVIYGYTGAEVMELYEDSHVRWRQIEDPHMTARKRKAANAPTEDIYFGHAHSGIARPCGARTHRSHASCIITSSEQTPVVSPTASRTNSYVSTASMDSGHPSSATTTLSHGQYSPTHLAGGNSPTLSLSPFTTIATITSANPSLETSTRPAVHPIASSTGTATSRKTNGIQKRLKTIKTAAELGAHKAEKRYECSYCGNRFKNKNEAKRHQNSLHVRRHSWSCSALSEYDRAFHDSTSRPGEADSCGYCGEEFVRSSHLPRSAAPNGNLPLRHVTEKDCNERIRHLQKVHKFQKCNLFKRFYRADHFRQHLKHSHAATSGQWRNILENCVIEEDPTPR